MSTSSSVAAVMLAYHPEPFVVDNVEALLQQVDDVFIVDNSPAGEGGDVLDAFDGVDRVHILAQDGNVGVAAGFNAGMRAAFDRGFPYVCIFDQDSTVTEGMIDRLVEAHRAAGSNAGIVAPALRSQATGVIYRRESGTGARDVDVLISSGSLFSRDLVERIGYHDEPLFIDYVDHDICLRARRYGMRNLKVFDAVLDHRFGDSDPVRILGRRVYLSNYSPLRHYYSARNRMIVIKRFGLGRWFWEDLWFTAKAWMKVILRETNRRAKIAAFLRGWRDGLVYPTR